MNKEPKDVFTKIVDLNKIHSLLKYACKNNLNIFCKHKEDKQSYDFQLNAHSLNSEMNLICTFPKDNPPPHILEKDAIICNITMDGNSYFFQTELHSEKNLFILNSPKTIFYLQRRENFRVKLPNSYKGILSVHKIDHQTTSIETQIRDISVSGCRVEISTPKIDLLLGQTIEGVISMGDRNPLEIKGLIRDVKKVKNSSLIGLEFIKKDSFLERELFALTLNLYRELVIVEIDRID